MVMSSTSDVNQLTRLLAEYDWEMGTGYVPGAEGATGGVTIGGGSPWLAGLDIDDFSGVAELAAAFGADILSPYYREIDLHEVERAHELGLEVIPWTVNNSADMFLLLDYGVDGINTDYPDELLQFVRAR